MFVLTTITDTIRIPANMLALPTLAALHREIDFKFPNRVLMDLGLLICRYGDCLKITNGSCVPGDGGSHHDCSFRMVVFRPFVEEVLLGKVVKSTPAGVQVSIGFFQDIFIPAYWMLRPSRYDEKVGLWVWTPNYDDDDDDEKDEDAAEVDGNETDEKVGKVKTEPSETGDTNPEDNDGEEKKTEGEEGEEDGDRFEMEIGAEIRFKVKSIQFTQITDTAKGMQATTTMTAHSHTFPKEQEEKTSDKPLRKRSLSVDISEASAVPATMQIIASICEDGLGLTSWWRSEEDGEDEEAVSSTNDIEESEIDQS